MEEGIKWMLVQNSARAARDSYSLSCMSKACWLLIELRWAGEQSAGERILVWATNPCQPMSAVLPPARAPGIAAPKRWRWQTASAVLWMLGAVSFVPLLPDLFQARLWPGLGRIAPRVLSPAAVLLMHFNPLNFIAFFFFQSQTCISWEQGVLGKVCVPVLSHVLPVWVTSACCCLSRSMVYVPFVIPHAASVGGPDVSGSQSQSGSCCVEWQCCWYRGSCHWKRPWSSSLHPLCLGTSLRLWLANSGSKKVPNYFLFWKRSFSVCQWKPGAVLRDAILCWGKVLSLPATPGQRSHPPTNLIPGTLLSPKTTGFN